MKLDHVGEVAELKGTRDRLETLLWRCQNPDVSNAVLRLALDGQLLNVPREGQDPLVIELAPETLQIVFRKDELKILNRALGRVAVEIVGAIKIIDDQLAQLGVESPPVTDPQLRVFTIHEPQQGRMTATEAQAHEIFDDPAATNLVTMPEPAE